MCEIVHDEAFHKYRSCHVIGGGAGRRRWLYVDDLMTSSGRRVSGAIIRKNFLKKEDSGCKRITCVCKPITRIRYVFTVSNRVLKIK